MKYKLKFIVPYIPIIGIILVFISTHYTENFLQKDKFGNYESIFTNRHTTLNIILSGIVQVISILIVLDILKNVSC